MTEPRIAVLASEGLLLDSLLETWQEHESLRGFVPQLVAIGDAAGQSALFAGKALAFENLEQMDWSSVALLMVLESSLVVEAHADRLAELPCPVIGSRQSLSSLEPELFDYQRRSGILAVPQAATRALQTLLDNLAVESLEATILLPASLFGKSGVEELAMQTARLLNAQAVEKYLFEQQLPFNCFPLADDIDIFRQQLTQEWQQVFPEADVHIAALQVPVFHGMGMQLGLVLAEPLDMEKLEMQWQGQGGLSRQQDNRQLSVINAAQEEGRISFGDVRPSPFDEHRIDLWLAFDDMQLGNQGLLSAADFLLKFDL